MAGGLYALSYPSFLGHGFLPLVFVALSLFLWKLESYHLKPGILIVLGFNKQSPAGDGGAFLVDASQGMRFGSLQFSATKYPPVGTAGLRDA